MISFLARARRRGSPVTSLHSWRGCLFPALGVDVACRTGVAEERPKEQPRSLGFAWACSAGARCPCRRSR
eukprot:10281049-Prorocentrum_lima.AAC.1